MIFHVFVLPQSAGYLTTIHQNGLSWTIVEFADAVPKRSHAMGRLGLSWPTHTLNNMCHCRTNFWSKTANGKRLDPWDGDAQPVVSQRGARCRPRH